MTERIAGPALVLAAVTCLAACDLALRDLRAETRDEWSRSYQLSPDGVVEIVNGNGLIAIRRGSGPGVSIRAERIARAAHDDAAKELLERIEIIETTGPDRVRVETKRLATSGIFSGHVEVRYDVEVPTGARVLAQNTNGEVKIDGISGGATATTTNGAIRASRLSGAITATTTNGEIDVEMESVTGEDVELETTNGRITLRLPDTAKASITARTNNGGIDTSRVNLEDEDRPDRRRMYGRLNGGGARVSLETTNGGIRIEGR